jgi:hypothetical protein
LFLEKGTFFEKVVGRFASFEAHKTRFGLFVLEGFPLGAS